MDEIQSEADARVAAARSEAAAQAAQAQQTAESQVADARRAAQQRIDAAAAQMDIRRGEEEARTGALKVQMHEGAAALDKSLADVKQELASVEADVARVTDTLQRSMEALEAALAQAENGIHGLGSQMAAFPDNAPRRESTAQPKKAPAQSSAQSRPVHTAVPDLDTPATLSEMLLDRLVRILDKK